MTATRTELIGECVGSTSFGGDWPMTPEVEATLERRGWERPWSADVRTWTRQHPLSGANRLALACVRALQLLECEMADLDVELVHEEPDELRRYPGRVELGAGGAGRRRAPGTSAAARARSRRRRWW